MVNPVSILLIEKAIWFISYPETPHFVLFLFISFLFNPRCHPLGTTSSFGCWISCKLGCGCIGCKRSRNFHNIGVIRFRFFALSAASTRSSGVRLTRPLGPSLNRLESELRFRSTTVSGLNFDPPFSVHTVTEKIRLRKPICHLPLFQAKTKHNVPWIKSWIQRQTSPYNIWSRNHAFFQSPTLA